MCVCMCVCMCVYVCVCVRGRERARTRESARERASARASESEFSSSLPLFFVVFALCTQLLPPPLRHPFFHTCSRFLLASLSLSPPPFRILLFVLSLWLFLRGRGWVKSWACGVCLGVWCGRYDWVKWWAWCSVVLSMWPMTWCDSHGCCCCCGGVVSSKVVVLQPSDRDLDICSEWPIWCVELCVCEREKGNEGERT